jgi:branched-chain amino acid transport system substrate-binding protein
MKSIVTIMAFCCALAFSACAPRTIGPGIPVTAGSEETAIMRSAAEAMDIDDHAETIRQCNRLLAGYPQSTLADDALLLKAQAQLAMGDAAKGEKTLRILQERFPQSALRPEADYLMLRVLFQNKRHRDVIDMAGSFLERRLPNATAVKVYALMGDSYRQLGLPVDAFIAYANSSAIAEGPQVEAIAPKLREAASLLTLEEAVSLLQGTTGSQARGYLFLRLGAAYAEKGLYQEATDALYAFLERYPDHREADTAREMIADFMRKSIYDRYTIGCLLPLSGPYKVFGERALDGIEFAFSRFSEGRQETYRLLVRDTGADPQMMETAFQELMAENVAAILGPISTAEYAAVEAQENGIPIMTLTQKERITEIGDYVFRNFLTPRSQAERLVAHASMQHGIDKFAILYPEEKYGRRFMNHFWDEVIANRGEVVGVESYATVQTDYSDAVKKLVGLYYDVPGDLAARDKYVPATLTDVVREYRRVTGRHDIYIPVKKKIERTDGTEEPEPIVDFGAVFIPDAPLKSAQVVPQLAYHNVSDVLIMGTNLWYTDQMLEMADIYLQNAVLTTGFFPESSRPEVADFVRAYKAAYGKEPGYIEAVAYDSATVLFQILARPDVNHRPAFRNALVTMPPHEGATGPVAFDPGGELRTTPYLLQIKGKAYVELQAAGVRSAEAIPEQLPVPSSPERRPPGNETKTRP